MSSGEASEGARQADGRPGACANDARSAGEALHHRAEKKTRERQNTLKS